MAVLVIDQGVTKEQISQYVYSKFSDVAWEVVDSYFPTVKQISALVD